MAGQTVIDTLIVKLGLDPKEFTKGKKEAAEAVLDTEKTVEKSAKGMNRNISGVAAKWLTVAAAIRVVKGAVNIITDVAERTRRLGIDAKNYDTIAARLRNYENAVEMFGGNAEDARKSVAGFNQSVFDLAYNGQMDQSLIMLARLGVQFQTATGEARDFNDIILDTADAIAEAQKQGMSRGNAFQYLQQSGFDAGTAQMILAGRGAAEASLAAQEQRRQVSSTDVGAATDIMQARTGMRQAREGAEIAFMQSPAGKALEKAMSVAEELMTPSGAAEAASKALDGLANSGNKLMNLLDSWSAAAAGSRGLRNNNPGNMRAVGNQAADRAGFRVFGSMDEGIRAAEAQLQRYADRGINTVENIISTWAPPSENDTKSYIAHVVAETGMKPGEVVDSGMRAVLLGAMFRHESGAKAPDAGQIADALTSVDSGMGSDPLSRAGGASPSPSAQGAMTVNKTDVQIDNITVQTRATDAQAMAADMDAALQRKLLVAHAEQGMQ